MLLKNNQTNIFGGHLSLFMKIFILFIRVRGLKSKGAEKIKEK